MYVCIYIYIHIYPNKWLVVSDSSVKVMDMESKWFISMMVSIFLSYL